MNEFINAIRSAGFKGEIEPELAAREKYAHDASLFEMTPALVVAPRDAEDIEILVKHAKPPVSLTPRAAGTDMSGGPLTESVLVDVLRHMNHMGEVGEDSAISEPGVYYRDFEKATLAKGLLLPSYPASRELCAIGGMVANNSGGEKTLAYGKTDRYVQELSVVLSDAALHKIHAVPIAEIEEGLPRRLYQLLVKNRELLARTRPTVSKNSAGYNLWDILDEQKGTFDLTKLFVGSQGTIGIITEVRFRLVRPKPASRLLVVFLRDLAPLGALAQVLLAAYPESLESYDDHTFHLAVKAFPSLAKYFTKNLFALAFQFLPEFFAVLTHGVPKLVLMAEFTGDTDEEAARKAIAAREAIAGFGLTSRVTSSAADAHKYWVMRRESFNLLRHHVKNMRTAPFIDDLVVRPAQLAEFLPRLYKILDEYPIVYTIAGHVGDANFHIIPLMDMHRPDAVKIIEELSARVYALVAEFHGSITGEHNDGLIRTPFLSTMYGPEVCALFAEVEKLFDPADIFNPGKKVGGSLRNALDHLAK